MPEKPQCMGPLPTLAKLTPLSADRFALQVTVSKHAHEQLCYAKELLGHALPSGDLATVIESALDLLVEKLESQKFAKCARTRPRRGTTRSKTRYVPAHVRRTVWKRDGGQCTFVSEHGKRCEARSCLEFDHIEAVARGGETSTSGMRLRCRAHNQFEAERAFGVEFMRNKREQARGRAARRKARTQAEAPAPARTQDYRPA